MASGSQLDFPHASTDVVVGVKMEMKVCEGECGGRTFYRPVPLSQRLGVKICPTCTEKRERRRGVN